MIYFSIVFRQEEAIFRSENVSTISILKDVMSKKATEKKITLNISYGKNFIVIKFNVKNNKNYYFFFFIDLSNETIGSTLNQMLPKIAHYKSLTDQYNLIEPLKELVMDGSTEDVLTPEHRRVLDNADSIREQYKQTPVHLNRLCSKLFCFSISN